MSMAIKSNVQCDIGYNKSNAQLQHALRVLKINTSFARMALFWRYNATIDRDW